MSNQEDKYGVDDTWMKLHESLLGQAHLDDGQIEQLLAEQFTAKDWVWDDKYTYNPEDDTYITQIPAARKAVKLPGSVHRSIISSYSNWGGNPASINSLSTSFGLPREWISQYLSAHGVTHDSPPYSREQLNELEEEDLLKITMARKNASVHIKSTNAAWRQTKRDADKWQKFKTGTVDPLSELDINIGVVKLAPKRITKKPFAALVGLTDNHFGAFADTLTTGAENNKSQVRQSVLNAVQQTIESWRGRPDVVYVPVGSDFFHTDGISRGTQAGTPQSMHGSGASILKEGIELLVTVIENIKPHCKQVVPVAMFGNHDRTSAHAAMMYLEGYYRKDRKVAVHGSRLTRCYLQYGVNMISITHGDNTKPQKYASLAASEAPKIWGETTERFVFGGHEHHLEALDFGGITYYKLPSLAPTDEWHHDKGYTDSKKLLMSFVFNRDTGLESTFYATGK